MNTYEFADAFASQGRSTVHNPRSKRWQVATVVVLMLFLKACAASETAVPAPSIPGAGGDDGEQVEEPAYRYTQLPGYLARANFVVKTSADWQDHVREHSVADAVVEPPCDFETEMLVVWRSPTGTSGCSAPQAGIAAINEEADKLIVEFFAGYSSGACQAYYQPVVAACLNASDKPVEISGGANTYIYLPPNGEAEAGQLIEVPY